MPTSGAGNLARQRSEPPVLTLPSMDVRVQILALGFDGVCNARGERQETPLVTAVRCGSESVIAGLVRHGSATAAAAARGGRVEVVDVLARDSRGRTALHWAAELGHGAGILDSLLGALPKPPAKAAIALSPTEQFECVPPDSTPHPPRRP